MKKLLCLMLALLPVLFCVSCSRTGRDPLAYRREGMRAEVILTKNGIRLRGLLTLAPETEDGTARNAEMLYSSPESVSGMNAVRKNGLTTVKLGDKTVSANNGYFEAAEMIAPAGTVTEASVTETDGKKVTVLTVSSAESTYEVMLTESGTPLRITGNGVTLDVVWFEKCSDE